MKTLLWIAFLQSTVAGRVESVSAIADPGKRIVELQKLLTPAASEVERTLIARQMFRASVEARQPEAIIQYGEALLAEGSADVSVLANMAIAFGDQWRNLDTAWAYVKDAGRGESDPELVLEAKGWILCRMGRSREGEPLLRQSLRLRRTESVLFHLAEVLGHSPEAEDLRRQAADLWIESLRPRFQNEPISDFTLQPLDGRPIRLSDFKGKVIMLHFWATWCGPCRRELPAIAEAYRKYKAQGFEVLAITAEDAADVAEYLRDKPLPFPTVLDGRMEATYGVEGYPATIFIDRSGRIRLRHGEFTRPFELHAIVEDLLQK